MGIKGIDHWVIVSGDLGRTIEFYTRLGFTTFLARCGVSPEVGPATRTCARGPATSVPFRDPDGSLVDFTMYGQRPAGARS
jgi:catechol 2,3-dioxygenase-like lactoylglutathione lyase family enzyme